MIAGVYCNGLKVVAEMEKAVNEGVVAGIEASSDDSRGLSGRVGSV